MARAKASLIAALAVFTFLSVHQTSSPAQDKQAPKTGGSVAASSAPQASGSSQYAGSDACKTCHADEYASWEKSPHWKTTLDTRGGAPKQGCEACHGAAASHVADPSDTSKLFLFEKASAKQINARCLES